MSELKDMKIMIFPSKYIQGDGAMNLLPEVMEKFGDKPFIVATKSMVETSKKLMGNTGKVEQFGGECSRSEIDRIKTIAKDFGATAIAAVGGGKPIDASKVIADEMNIPLVSCATIAATDAPTSGCAVIYTEEGVYVEVLYQKRNPDVVLMDTDIVLKAPTRFLISGMGDALATFFEANSCEHTGSLSEAFALRTKTTMALTKLCLDILLDYGRQAVKDAQNGIKSEAVEAIIEANSLLSGIGFESGGLGSAHSVHNGLTVLPATHHLYHGEKVAFGTLTGLHLYDDLGIIDEIYDFCIDVGLPVTFEDLRIPNVTDEELKEVAESSYLYNFMSHEPVELSVEKVIEALKKTDKIGREKKAAKGM
ncbi:MAG: glycerol dehydrogenase [Firmicutes bacterium HGW-Firmicutes-4]|jgi:glycerol dehydrogenase|nr:MAG: glycerol dehydrogenase [Firmicutes bacterium HGW-Firmicutes-4]